MSKALPSSEMVDLWTAIFGEPPIMAASTSLYVQLIVEGLPKSPPYIPRYQGSGRRSGTM